MPRPFRADQDCVAGRAQPPGLIEREAEQRVPREELAAAPALARRDWAVLDGLPVRLLLAAWCGG